MTFLLLVFSPFLSIPSPSRVLVFAPDSPYLHFAWGFLGHRASGSGRECPSVNLGRAPESPWGRVQPSFGGALPHL